MSNFRTGEFCDVACLNEKLPQIDVATLILACHAPFVFGCGVMILWVA